MKGTFTHALISALFITLLGLLLWQIPRIWIDMAIPRVLLPVLLMLTSFYTFGYRSIREDIDWMLKKYARQKQIKKMPNKYTFVKYKRSVTSLLLLATCLSYAQVTGIVFRDFDGDGTRDANEPLVPGVTVTAYNTAGAQCGTTTSAGNTAPNYSVPGCGTGAVRVEFVIPITGTCLDDDYDFSSLGGSIYGSSVQFVNGNSTNVNFAIFSPEDYNTGAANTNVYVPVYTHGDPLVSGGASGARDWLVGFPYNNTGGTVPAKKMNGNIIGSTWGLAYSKRAKKLFTSAVFHRHIGLGTMGSGGIYIIDEATFTPSTFYDLDANGYRTRADNTAPAYGLGTSYNFDQASGTKYSVSYLGGTDAITGQPAGLGVIGTNGQRGLVGTPTTPGYDPAAFEQAGKVSLGDLEISDDEQYLFVINLYSRKLLRLKLNNAANPTGVIEVMEYSLPNIAVNNGLLRPWALKYYRGKLYVGAVSTGENGGQNIVNGATDLRSYVFEVTDPKGSLTFNATPILNQPLNYPKGGAASGLGTKWNPWTKTSQSGIVVGLNTIYPQPILSDIEFSDRNDMILAFTDRAGNQYGGGNYIYLGDNATLSYATSGGDLQIAGLNCTNGTYTRETNGQYVSINGETYTGSPGNFQGPGNGEFFHGEAFSIHSETAMGALAMLKGDARVMITNMDPLNFLSGGTTKFSTTNGYDSDRYQLYADGITGVTNPGLGKANGLGDVELGGSLPPIEIGNRVWLDNDRDGIQTAGEPGIANVTLELLPDFDNNGTPDAFTASPICIASQDFGTAANIACGGNADWSIPDWAKVSDNLRTSTTIVATSQTSQCLQLSDVGLNIPLNATISGVTVRVERASLAANTIADQTIQLIVGGAPVGTNKATASAWPVLASEATASYGNSTDLWSTTLTPAQVNATNFGVTIQARSLSGVAYAYIDYVEIDVCYTLPNGVIATTTTSSSGTIGTWYFNNTNVSDGDPVTAGVQPGIQPNKTYLVRVGSTDWSGGVGTGDLFKYPLTLSNTGGAGQPDVRDNDATIPVSTIPTISFTAGNYGQNNHTLDMGFQLPPCEIEVTTQVGNCYDSNGNTAGGTNVAPLVVNVFWFSRPGTENITVAVPGATLTPQTLTVSSLNGSGQLTFEVSASGAMNTVTANFATTTTCTGTATYTSPSGVCLNTPCVAGSTGGNVWQDYDNDGVKDAAETQGLSGVTVKAYDCNGNVIATTTTDALGQYTFGVLSPAPSVGTPIRVEFSNLPSGYNPTANGIDGRTDVQFISAPECNVDFGVVNPTDYCQTNPNLVTPLHTNGQLSANVAMSRFPYTSPIVDTDISTGNQLGTTWGIAYKRSTQRLFASSFFKRHSAMGPSGPGAIYQIDPNAAVNGTLFFDMSTVESVGTIPTNATRGLTSAAAGSPNTDASAFSMIGEVSLGDIDITDDEQYFFTINLASKKLYRVPTVAPTTGNITGWTIPNPGCSGGEWRPFAIKVRGSKVYVGGVCDAANSQSRADLEAFVYEFNPTSGVFTQVMNFPLNFKRGHVTYFGCSTGAQREIATQWNAWTDVHTVFADCGIHDVYPQPMLSDIEFDVDGSMILAIMDRWGHQTGEANNYPNGVFGEQGVTGGDIMRAYNNNGLFQIENNGVAGPLTVGGTVAQNNYNSGASNPTFAPAGQGVGGREFYFGDTWQSTHDERSAGGLAIKPGSGEVVVTAMDPAFGIYSNGAIWLSNTTGLQNSAFVNQAGGVATFGKGYGIGDIELLCNALPIQIGNYVWFDTDGDGIQDPCEAGISGVKVDLHKKDGTLIGQTTTAANGEYYFDVTNVDTIAPYGTGGFTGLSPNTAYVIVVGRTMTQFNTTTGAMLISGVRYLMTPSNTGEGASPDQNDNDATLLSGLTAGAAALNGYPGYCATMPASGSNHTFDFGFKPCTPLVVTINGTNLTCGANNGAATASSTGTAPFTYDWNGTPTGDGTATITGLAAGTYTVTVTDLAGCTGTRTVTLTQPTAIVPVAVLANQPSCASPDGFIDLSVSGGTPGYTYDWSNDGAEMPDNDPQDLSGVPAGTYTVTVTDANGCTATTSITIVSPINGVSALVASVTGNACVGTFALTVSGGTAPITYDWNNDGTGDNDDAQNLTGVSAGTYTVIVTDNNGCSNTASGAYFGCDLGDLQDPAVGIGNDDYKTTLADGGPSHEIVAGFKLGASEDQESDGQPSLTAIGDDSAGTTPDDEDGVVLPMFVAGQMATVPVTYMVPVGPSATIAGLFDWNDDGKFDGAGEMVSQTVMGGSSGTVNLAVSVPVNAVILVEIGLRFRISTNAAVVMNTDGAGAAPNGEIEDYIAQVMGFDLGDLPDGISGNTDYSTLLADNGPRHKIISTLRIGALEDAETDGQPTPDPNTNGDDSAVVPSIDDEDGISAMPTFVIGQTASLSIVLSNTTGGNAQLTAYIDFNNNGNLADVGEVFTTNVLNGGTSAMLSIAVPSNAVLGQDLGLRLRLTTSATISPNGLAPDGEVEDYEIRVICVQPTATVAAVLGTCSNSGTPNNNASIGFSTVVNGDKADIVQGATYGAGPSYNAGTNVTINAGTATFSGLLHNTQYTVRVFNNSNSCFQDFTVTTPSLICFSVAISDPCVCHDVVYDVIGDPLELLDYIDVTAPSGSTWQIVAHTGLETVDPTTNIPLPIPSTLTYIPGLGVYRIQVAHTSGIGYSATVSNGTFSLSISNLCTKNIPQAPALASAYCGNAAAVPLPAAQPNFTMVYHVGSPAGPTITAFNPTLYPVSSTVDIYARYTPDNASDCPMTLLIPVSILSLPVLSTQPGNICEGQSINLATLVTGSVPTGTLTYYASQANATAGIPELINNIVTPVANTTYYVRSVSGAGCAATAPLTVTVSTNPVPTVTNGTICAGSTIDLNTLVTNAGGGVLTFYSSYANAVASTPTISALVSPSSATNYYVRSTNGNGCYSIKEITISINAPVCGAITITGPN